MPVKGPRREAAKIGFLLAGFLRGTTVGRSATLHALEAAWSETVGPEIAAETRVASYREGVLRIEVRSSALLQELATYYKASLLESLRGALARGAAREGLERLEFRLGSFGSRS